MQGSEILPGRHSSVGELDLYKLAPRLALIINRLGKIRISVLKTEGTGLSEKYRENIYVCFQGFGSVKKGVSISSHGEKRKTVIIDSTCLAFS